MAEIQLGSGSSSAATHRLTQSSHTLNRRYVSRPTNIAIEEAAHSHMDDKRSVSAPSRLVNLRVHAADLAQLQQSTNAPTHPPTSSNSAMVPKVIELGSIDRTMPDNLQPPVDLSQIVPAEAPLEEEPSYLPTISNQSAIMPSNNYPQIYDENTYNNYSQNTLTSSSELTTTSNSTDTQSLAMNIAADYAAASLGATSTEPTSLANSSIDTIAQAASEAIAAIRTASGPEEIAEQITSLQTFAENIRNNSNTPEMAELSDTIDKFISVAMKSSRVQEEVDKKLAQKQAAEQTAKTSIKVAAKKAAPVKTVAKKTATSTTRKPAATRPTITKSAARTATRPVTRPTRAKVSPITRRNTAKTTPRPQLVAEEEQALRKALRSVAAMDGEDEPTAKTAKKSTARKKGSGKRFALAFFCAIACVGAVVYFVGSNIPDISVKVAAMQTGIEATYPAYIPRDFSLSDISSEEGKITLTFKGPEKATFTLTEEKSSWDSTTLLRNFVEANWQNNYTTTHEQGITIYISGANATWVNGGVLYKITANSNTLTKKQLRNIVISL